MCALAARSARCWSRVALLVVLLTVPVSCHRQPEPPPGAPNLVLITIDTTRQDRLAAYGSQGGVTPHLDRFARQGVTFVDARTQVPITLPSHTSMLTGLGVLEHRVRENGAPVDDDLVTLAELLAGHGYQTAAFVSAFVLDRRFGLDQGFALYDDTMSHAWPVQEWQGHQVDRFERPADETTNRAVAWLSAQARAQRPFFLWVHYFDPHAPWQPPEPWRDRTVHPYDGEVAFMDSQIGRLLDRLDHGATGGTETLVIIASDHGESLGEHGIQGHGHDIYEPAMRAVLMMRYPGSLPAGARVHQRVVLADLAPTALDLLGLDPQTLPGTSLRPLLRGGHARAAGAGEPVYMETLMPALRYNRSAVLGLLHGDWKLLHWRRNGWTRLFQLSEDPAETVDRFAEQRERGEAMLGELLALIGSDHDGLPQPVQLDREVEEKLRALGYVQDDTAGERDRRQ